MAARALPKILAWDGDGGLAGVLATLSCERLPVADAQILFDVDDEAAFAEAEALLLRLDAASPGEALALLDIHGAGDTAACEAITRRLGHALDMQDLVERSAGRGIEDILGATPRG